jgi:type IV fimbrial biogenesis protein FimT
MNALRASRTRTLGFTLVEMMVVVALVAILGAIAVPGFRNLLLNQRLASNTNDFIAALSLARTEAMKRSQKVTLVPRNLDWANGWELTTTVDGDTAVLRTFDALGAGVEVDSGTGNAFKKSVTFDANGFARGNAGCLTFKAESGRRSSVILSMSGRSKVCDPDKRGDCGLSVCDQG